MKDRGSHRTIAIVLTLGAGLALVLAGRGLGAGGQPQPRPHAPLTMEQRLARSAYWASKRGLQFGIPAGAYEHAVRDAKALPAVEAATPGVLAWNAIGPQPMLKNRPNFGGVFTGPALNTSEGRVSAVAADPTTRNLVYVGAAGGGVWRSTDGGGTFTPVFDGNPTQAIGAITVDHRGNVWVGTGEGVESDSYYGQGIFKSSDHGSTWTQLTGGAGGPFIHGAFRRIAVEDSVPPHLLAAVTFASSLSRADAFMLESNPDNDGLWRSTDGGVSWVQLGNSTVSGGRPSFNGCTFFSTTDPCPATDVVIDPNNPNRAYAAISNVNVFISTDGGVDWSEAKFPGIMTGTTGQIGRANLAVTSAAAGQPATVYASVGGPDGRFFKGVFRSTDSGVTWEARTIPSVVLSSDGFTTTLDGDGKGIGRFGQSGYDQTVTVAPAMPQEVYLGGVGPYVSTDGGASWSFIAGSTENKTVQETHTDQQASTLDPFNPNKLYIGNDGGFYFYDLAGRNWTTFFGNNQNRTISNAQIQAIGPHPTDNTRLLAGFQDNGTQLFKGSPGWDTVETGDGGFALFDFADPSFAYHTFATSGGPQPSRSTDGGMSWDSHHPPARLKAVIGKDAFGFYPPLAADPASAARVMIGGHLIYVSTDGMLSWQVQSASLTGSCTIDRSGCALQDIEFVPNTTMAWALSMQGGRDGFVVSNTAQANLDSGAAWSDVTAKLPFSSTVTQATGIAVDPNPGRSSVAYLSISGFTAATGIGHIFRTMDFGKTWTRVDGAGGASPLPDVPTLRVLVDNTDSTGNTLLAGTDIGVFRSTDSGATWAAFNLSAIPAVPVFDIEQNKNGVIFAGTHGRGAYQLSGEGPTPKPTPTATATPGANASSTAVAVTTVRGANVGAGSVTITNTTGVAENIDSVTVTVSDPAIFSSLTLSGGGQSVEAAAAAGTVFNFTPIPIAAGTSLTFSLNAAISTNLAAANTGVTFAAMTFGVAPIQRGDLPMFAALLLLGVTLMAMPTGRRRRIVLAVIGAIALAAAQSGCGGGGNNVTLFASSQAVSAVSATYASGAGVIVSGLPAQLGTIRVF